LDIPHKPVLLEEVKDVFKECNNGYIVDCTVGYGGHSEALLEQNPNIKLVIFEHAKFSTVVTCQVFNSCKKV